MAANQKERSAKSTKKRQDNDEVELRMWTKSATRTVLKDLMQWHGISENAEAMTLALHHLHALGPEGSKPFFTPPRHDYQIPENVARTLDHFRERKMLLIGSDE